MKLKDYIELLSSLPQDSEVDIDYDGYYEPEVKVVPFVRREQRMVDGQVYDVDIVYLGHVDANP